MYVFKYFATIGGLIIICLIITCLPLSISNGVAQQIAFSQDNPDGPYDIPAVKRALEDQFPPGSGWYGITEKHLNRLGDRVSIALIKFLEEQDLKDSRKVKRVLQIIRHAFLYPTMITFEEDKNPKFTLLFLEHMEHVVRDTALKREISELTKFVTDPKIMRK